MATTSCPAPTRAHSRSLDLPAAIAASVNVLTFSAARRIARQALEALEPKRWPQDAAGGDEDAHAGMAWFNGLTPTARRHWLEVADSAVPAEAWRAFQNSVA